MCSSHATLFNDLEPFIRLIRIQKTDKLLDVYYPLEKLTKKEFKQTIKPWITAGILNSIKRKK